MNKSDLKKRAKELLANQNGFNVAPDVEADKDTLINQLMIYQAELEIQNEELIIAQEMLSTEKYKFEQLFQNSPVPYLVIDSKAVIINANHSFYSLLNIRSHGGNKPLVVYIDTNSHNIFFDKFNIVKSKHQSETFEIILKYLNSNDIWTLCSLKPFLTSGDEYHYLVTFTEITRIKEMEEDLRIKNSKLSNLNTILEQRVNEEMGKRMRNERILFEQQKFADMGQMINAIAHQWRQPLNGLGLMIQLTMDDIKNGSANVDIDGDKEQMLGIISHLSDTIDDFRNFFKVSNENISFSLTDSLIESHSLYDAKLKQLGIDFTLTCKCEDDFFELHKNNKPRCGPKHFIHGSKSKLKQVILNLIQNAIDAIYDTKKLGKINVNVSCETRHVSITIEDNGGGIKSEPLTKIFEPYFTTKDEGRGTGIGLYMSKTIIEDHFSGKLSVMNTNSGAKFIIQLPIVSPE